MWTVRLSDAQRDALRALIGAQGEVGPSLAGALEALELSRWDDLPEAHLPWDRVGQLAKAQGIGEADVVWDLAAPHRGRATTSSGKAKRPAAGGKQLPVRRRSA
jgi:hypothetical protein